MRQKVKKMSFWGFFFSLDSPPHVCMWLVSLILSGRGSEANERGVSIRPGPPAGRSGANKTSEQLISKMLKIYI